MPFRSFTDSTPWEQARRDLRFTATRTATRRQHAPLAEPLHALLSRWEEIDKERRDADDLLVDADAIVCAQTEALDDAVMALAAELLHEGDHDPADLTYRAYFPGVPGELTRLGLESAIASTREFAAISREIEPSFEVASILETITELEARGIEALIIRQQAQQNVDRVNVLIQAWKDGANAARSVVASALSGHAQKHRLPRGYAGAFFPTVAPERRPLRPSPRLSTRSAA